MSIPSSLYLDQDDLQRRLLALTSKTGYDIVQKHGQRIYGGPPPSWTGSQPDKGTEVYCYRIPRDCFEDELVPVFSSVGRIYELRLMIEFSGTNRSYCYVRYTTQEEAREAIRKLNNYHVRPGYPLAVTRSVDNRKLSIKTVPSIENNSADAVIHELSSIAEGVEKVKFQARGWLEVEFSTHRLAALARRQLVPGNVVMFDNAIVKQVDWADPEIEKADQEVYGKVLAVRNVPSNTPEYILADIFNWLSEGQVFSVVKAGATVLITFTSHGGALLAMEKSRDREVAGLRLELSWWSSNRRVDRGSYSSIPRNQLMGGNYEGNFVGHGNTHSEHSRDMALMAQRNFIANQVARQMAQPPPDYHLDYAFSGLSLTQNPRQTYVHTQPIQYPPPSFYSMPPNDESATGSQAYKVPDGTDGSRYPYSLFPSFVSPSYSKPMLAVPPLSKGTGTLY